jgi:hypothetical protein
MSRMVKRSSQHGDLEGDYFYKHFDLDLSESHRVKLYMCTLLDPRFKKFNMWTTLKYVENSQSVYSETI